MTEHVYKYVELTGSSPVSIEDAVAKALERARQTLRNIRWFVVSEIRGQIDEGQINHWQVTIKLGFTLEE